MGTTLYDSIEWTNNKPDQDIFTLGRKGFQFFKNRNLLSSDKEILTLIDFSLASTKKRLWVIDLQKKKTLFNTFVAHGKNTGDNFARSFSNTPRSNKSSLGFYLTGKTYKGKHGLSMYLKGMEKDFNDNARKRAIVMHGADYAGKKFIRKYGRLGRSYGCPAVPMGIHKHIIQKIKNGTCFFIYHPDDNYQNKSPILNTSK
jgi:hypothetical protein